MAEYDIWDDTRRRAADLQENALVSSYESEDVLENLIIMNRALDSENLTNNDLGTIGMIVLDMRVDIDDCIKRNNNNLAKFEMISRALESMDAQVRTLLPVFNIDYEKYREMIIERENDKLTVDYSEMVTDD